MAGMQRLLELALKGLEAERARIDSEISGIRSQLRMRSGEKSASEVAGTATTGRKRKRRRMSAEAKRKISEAMKRSHALRKAKAMK